MGGGGGKGGSTTSKVTIPQWLQDAAQANIAKANKVSEIGYTPYYGPDVAAFNGTQQAAFANTAHGANAFGMASPADPMAGMPQAQTFADGTQGYSSHPMYQQALDAFKAANPGQFAAISSLFVNPQSGAASGGGSGHSGGMGGKGGSSRSGGGGGTTHLTGAEALNAMMARIDGGDGGQGMSGASGSGGSGNFANTVGSYLPGGVNTNDPGSWKNTIAADVRNAVSSQGSPTAANTPQARPK